jgi:hypothetical protein
MIDEEQPAAPRARFCIVAKAVKKPRLLLSAESSHDTVQRDVCASGAFRQRHQVAIDQHAAGPELHEPLGPIQNVGASGLRASTG